MYNGTRTGEKELFHSAAQKYIFKSIWKIKSAQNNAKQNRD